jgi:heterokaryon incompatibility protein (HET)
MSSSNRDFVKLECQFERDMLIHSPVPRYATLSHVWGGAKPLRLMKDNYEELERGIDMSSLPPLFRDAIDLTKMLGISYIWIDSLWWVLFECR